MQKKISGSRKSLIINNTSNAKKMIIFRELAKEIFLHSCILAQEVSSCKMVKILGKNVKK